ncbi:MAG: HAD family hydrolase [Halothiobacillaceae bacterium]
MSKSGEKGLYLVLVSVHGLIRGHDLELGRDSDTGGQTLYVVELARALARMPEVGRVDLMTRRVVDPAVSSDYAQPEEDLGNGARIVRIEAGPDEYLPKEALWDNLNCFVDGALEYIHETGEYPALVHSHYADAGYVGARLAHNLGVPLIHTGHSLGRVKRRRLLAKGETVERIEETYAISRRILAEEETLASAARVIASTRHEVDEQYGLYDFSREEKMVVIPPGTDLSRFRPAEPDDPVPPIIGEVNRFLNDPDKPVILALSRPDERKNIATLVRAYGENPRLQELANLVVVAGNRDDIRNMEPGSRKVLTDLLLLIDAYDLYGRVAYPRKHRPEDVPDLYRWVARTRGVFINPALTEPFGLTLIEAAACGAPILATEDGGPRDIVAACQNGELIDPLDAKNMADRLVAVLTDREKWQTWSRNGIEGARRHYAWESHARRYLDEVRPLLADQVYVAPEPTVPDHALKRTDRALIADLDALCAPDCRGADKEALQELLGVLRANRRRVGFGVSTDKTRGETLARLKSIGVPVPDVIFSRSGTQIHYGPRLSRDEAWSRHIDYGWVQDQVEAILSSTPGVALLPRSDQGLRSSCARIVDPDAFAGLDALSKRFHGEDLPVQIQQNAEDNLVVLPVRASKGFALRFFAAQWDIPLERILVAGATATDEDMLRGNPLGAVVVPDGHTRFPGLTGLTRVAFTQAHYAAGILEAMRYYDFFGRCDLPEVAEDPQEENAR